MQVANHARWGALELIGHSVHKKGHEHEPDLQLRPGDVARLLLFCTRHGDVTGDELTLSLRSRSGEDAYSTALTIMGGLYPPTSWGEGEIVRDIQLLQIPGHLPPGRYDLLLSVGDGARGDEGVVLRRLEIGL
jgi:hypothetical protein